MEDMIIFSGEVMEQLAVFLRTEPIKYLFGMILTLFIVKCFRMLISIEDK